MNFLNGALISFVVLVTASNTFAADFQCFEFTKNETGYPAVPVVPAIITHHSETDGVIFSQEIIPLNEDVENVLSTFKNHDQICLKGRRGYGSISKFFAYAVQVK